MNEPDGMLDDDRLLELFERLALEAGRRILEVRDRGLTTETKSDSSPVTEADRAAEIIILTGLRAALPGMPCVAEEEVAAGVVSDTSEDAFILIDPLDGTREFINGKPDFTVNIALVRGGAPVVGTVYAPVRGEVFSGRPGQATMAQIGADFSVTERRQIAVRDMPDRPTVVASRSHRTPETDAFLDSLGDAEICSVGSSLKFGLLARGEADLYPRLGRTMEWDTAAGDAVLRAAGGQTLTLDGKPLIYGKRNQADDADFANPWFFACSRTCPDLSRLLAACGGATSRLE